MKRYLKSFLSFLKTKKFPNKEDLLELRDAPFSTSKGALIIFATTVVGLFLYLLLAISNTLTVEVPDYGGTMVEGVIGSPRFINPLLANSETDLALSSLVYAPITTLAKDCIGSPDGKAYQCTLPENVLFSDKSPLTSADVLFTFTTKKTIEVNKNQESDWREILIEAPNSTTVRISTTGDKASLKEKMSLGIVPKVLWESVPIESIEDSALNLKPVGAGAFKVASINYTNSLPSEVALVPNQHFVQDKPFLKRFFFRSYTNQLDLASALHNQEVDSTSVLKSDYIDTEIKNNYLLTPITNTKSISLWVSQAQSNSPEAQKIASISNMIDRKEILDTIEHGYGIPLYSKESTRSKAASKAEEVTISIAVQKDIDLLKTAEMLSSALQEFGILSTIQVFDQGLFIDQVTTGAYPFILMARDGNIAGYQQLIPLYTKSFVHITSHDVQSVMPPSISSPYESLSEANKWYTRTDKVWKWFIHK
ncbi:MAG: ABC transporter substrate-binding protein [Patescibacteria group bacterium]